MKHKKVMFFCIGIVIIIIASFISVIRYKTTKHEDFIIMLGNDFTNVEVNTPIDKTFVSNFMKSDYLLKIIKSDASKIVDDKILKISALVKKSNIAFVSIGTNDIKNQIKVDESLKAISFDDDIINRKIEILLCNVKEIVNQLKVINPNINIYLLKIDYFLNYKNEKIESYIDLINQNYKNITNPNLILITIVLVGYSLIGFIDDALIILKHQNEGLKAWQKFLMQAILAVGCYLYLENFVPGFTTEVTIPIVKVNIDFGWFYAVLVFIMFTGESNGVNLSDGLDGLATGLSMVAIAPFIIYAIMIKDYTIASYATAMVGALLGFMYFNYHPARIFMGDVGSLGLGGFLAILAILTKQELLLIVVGGVFLMETLSVIIQVVSFKTRGKRVFKMAPIHHHFEMLGWSEQQVTISFWFIGFICGIIAIVIGVM